MSEIVDQIEAALAAWEAAALAASNAPWTAITFYPNRSEVVNGSGIDGGVIVSTPRKDDMDAAHIARNDPAAVLRMVAGLRAVVALADEATGLDMTVEGDRGVGPRDTDTDPWLGDQILAAIAALFPAPPGLLGGSDAD